MKMLGNQFQAEAAQMIAALFARPAIDWDPLRLRFEEDGAPTGGRRLG
jgi:hypothetical protein